MAQKVTVDYVVNDFTHGELDPKMLSHAEMALYQKSAQQIRNMLVIPQGGVTRRFGTTYEETLSVTTDDAFQLTFFAYDEDNYYLALFLNTKIRIYKKDGTFLKEITSIYTTSQLTNKILNFTHSKNSLVICDGTNIPQQLVRGATDTDWVIGNFNFKVYPSFDFGDVDYSSFDFTIDNKNPGTERNLTSSGDIFTSDYLHGMFTSLGATGDAQIGVARITEIVDTKHAKVTVIYAFPSSITSGIKGTDCIVQENIYTSNNGYPTCATFYENRLVFGGTSRLPALIAMSKPNQYTNFDIGTGLATDAIVDIVQTDGLNAIKYLVGDQSLQVFTTDSEFVAIQFNNKVSGDETGFRKQSNIGISTVAPQLLDNQTFFVAKGGKRVEGFIYNDNTQSYQSLDISIFSAHLIRNPVDSSTIKNTADTDANWLLLINDDGTLVTYQSVAEQKVSAFTLQETDGEFQAVTRVDNTIFFVIKRNIEGTDYYYLEMLNFDSYTDSNVIKTYGTPTITVTGLDHLNGETVDVIADGAIYQDLGIIVGGQLTLEEAATNVEVGLHIEPILQPNPPQPTTQAGSAFFHEKKILQTFVYYYNSIGIVIKNTEEDVDKIEIPYRQFGEDAFELPEVSTEIFQTAILQDYSRRPSLIFTQELPYPMTILSIGYKVEI